MVGLLTCCQQTAIFPTRSLKLWGEQIKLLYMQIMREQSTVHDLILRLRGQRDAQFILLVRILSSFVDAHKGWLLVT